MDAMLDEMEPSQFEGWWQAYKLKPWGDDWHRASLQTARLANIIKSEINKFSSERLSDEDFYEDDTFVPRWGRPEDDPYYQEMQKQLDAADAIEGLGL